MRSEAGVIYYGLQYLVAHRPDGLGPDEAFSIRAACVPSEQWTYALWCEAARVVGVHRRELKTALGEDPAHYVAVHDMLGQAPVGQAQFEARLATPRPSPEQVEEVRDLARRLRHRAGVNAPRYDVELTHGLFAVINVPKNMCPGVEHLPGYAVVNEQVQVWLSDELRDFVVAVRLRPAPDLLPALDVELQRIEAEAEGALAVERASTCTDPDRYPAKLCAELKDMGIKGLRWTSQ